MREDNRIRVTTETGMIVEFNIRDVVNLKVGDRIVHVSLVDSPTNEKIDK